MRAQSERGNKNVRSQPASGRPMRGQYATERAPKCCVADVLTRDYFFKNQTSTFANMKHNEDPVCKRHEYISSILFTKM